MCTPVLHRVHVMIQLPRAWPGEGVIGTKLPGSASFA